MGKIKPLGSIANLLPLFVSFTTTAGATLGNISRSVKEVDNFVNSDKQNSAKPSLDSYLVRPPQEIEKTNTREEISKFANTSHDTVAKVKKIKEKATDEVLQKVKTGEISINQAYTTIQREEKEQKRNDEVKENTEKVSQARSIDDLGGLFKTIVIDPPWDWGDEEDVNQLGRARPDYATIPYGELLKYPVDKFADDNCHLYLWITNCSLPKGMLQEGLIKRPGLGDQTLDHYASTVQLTGLLQQYGADERALYHNQDVDISCKIKGLKVGFEVEHHNNKNLDIIVKKKEAALKKYDVVRFISSSSDIKMISKAVGERYTLKRGSAVTYFTESLFTETEYPLTEVVLGGIEAI